MSRTVIFLDIEGVLVHGPVRHSTPEQGLARKLAEKYDNPVIAQLPDLLCAQILDNFDPEACARVSRLCQQHDAGIVITSSWRLIHDLPHLQAIFQIAGISQVMDAVSMGSVRRDVIERYVWEHQVSSYIVLDDIDLSRAFGYRFIQCRKGFGLSEAAAALSALKCQTSRMVPARAA